MHEVLCILFLLLYYYLHNLLLNYLQKWTFLIVIYFPQHQFQFYSIHSRVRMTHGMWQLQRLSSQDVSHRFPYRASASVTVPKDTFNLTDRIVSTSTKLLYFYMCRQNVSSCLSLGTLTTGHVKCSIHLKKIFKVKKAEMYCNHMSVNTLQTYSLSYFIGKIIYSNHVSHSCAIMRLCSVFNYVH